MDASLKGTFSLEGTQRKAPALTRREPWWSEYGQLLSPFLMRGIT